MPAPKPKLRQTPMLVPVLRLKPMPMLTAVNNNGNRVAAVKKVNSPRDLAGRARAYGARVPRILRERLTARDAVEDTWAEAEAAELIEEGDLVVRDLSEDEIAQAEAEELAEEEAELVARDDADDSEWVDISEEDIALERRDVAADDDDCGEEVADDVADVPTQPDTAIVSRDLDEEDMML
ncbi:hypothetical protein ONZ45_g7461 [Pleurotus djamor]|nr:hypothetical protein ONZ45_g7461 [Pleurotus djamor]